MVAEGLSASVIAAFKHAYSDLAGGSAGSIAEAAIAPVESLLSLEGDIRGTVKTDTALLKVPTSLVHIITPIP